MKIHTLISLSKEKTIHSGKIHQNFSVDFVDYIYNYNKFPTESLFAALRVSKPHLNLLIIIVASNTDYKIIYCNHIRPSIEQSLTEQLRTLTFNPTISQCSPVPEQVHIVTQQNNPPQKII